MRKPPRKRQSRRVNAPAKALAQRQFRPRVVRPAKGAGSYRRSRVIAGEGEPAK